MPDSAVRQIVVSPLGKAWLVEWPDGRSILARKTEAVDLGRQIAKELPGRTLLTVLKTDGSVGSSATYGADRPPITSFLRPAKRAPRDATLDRPLPPGMRVLVVEDEYFTADAMKRSLESAGAHVVGPAGDVGQAISLIDEGGAIQLAVLDINLGGEKVFPVATRLREKATPFIFTTGYGLSHITPDFAGSPICEKPCSMDRLFALIRQHAAI